MGSLTECQYCGSPLELVDGTDPDNKGSNGEWVEKYKCSNGHVGHYEYTDATGEENYRGACASDSVF